MRRSSAASYNADTDRSGTPSDSTSASSSDHMNEASASRDTTVCACMWWARRMNFTQGRAEFCGFHAPCPTLARTA